MVAHVAFELATPDGPRFGGRVSSGSQADYSLWPFGIFLAPLDPGFIEAAEADNQPASAVGGAASPVPTALIPAPTPPTATAEAPPPTATETPPTASPPLTQERPAPPSPTPSPTCTPVPMRAPMTPQLPVSTRPPTTPSPSRPSTTPVTRPEDQPPTSTRTPTRTPSPTASPTRTPSPTASPTRTPSPTAPPPIVTTVGPSPTPSPTLTPTPPSVGFADTVVTASEEDGRATLVVRLSEAYHLPVTVSYNVVLAASTATRGVDYVLADGTLTFNPRTSTSAGDRERQIVVTLLRDNLNEDNEQVVIRLTGFTNAVSNGADIATLIITDSSAPPTVRLVGAEQRIAERAGSAAFTVELNQVSALPVAVPYTVAGTASAGGTAPGANDHNLRGGVVMIPAGTTSARVRFTIFDDQVDEGDETIIIRLDTPLNADLVSPTEHIVTIEDDDTAKVNLSGQSFTLDEGESTAYSVRLNSQPTANVTVRLEPDAQLHTSPRELSFTPLNWSQPQTVTLTAVDDFVAEDDPHPGVLQHVVTSADPRYNRIDQRPAGSLDIRVSIHDDDTAGVIIGATGPLTVSEDLAETATYTVALRSQPTAPVTVSIKPDHEVTTSPAALVFTVANWDLPQTVTVAAVDDAVDEDGDGNQTLHDGLVAHMVASDDPRYGPPLQAADVRVKIRDNDTAGLALSPGSLDLSESPPGQTTGTYTLTLTSRPTDTVTVDLTSSAPGQITFAPAQLVFAPEAWDQPQTVTVTATNDLIDEGPAPTHTVTIWHSASGDRHYDELSPVGKVVTIADDDTAGLVIAPASSPFTITEGLTGTYTVFLTSQPTATVRVGLTISATDQISTAPPLLEFDATNWTQPQTVTVTALDNYDLDGSRAVTIAHTLDASDDPTYAALAPVILGLTVADDDVAGVAIAPHSGTLAISETIGFNTGSLAVTLTSRPTAPVTVTLSPDAQVLVAPATLTFTPGDWNTPQEVIVTARPDNIVETTPHTGTIGLSSTSADPNYTSTWPVYHVLIDDSVPSKVSVDDAPPLDEGDSGESLALFPVRLHQAAPYTVTVSYTTYSITATAGEDFWAESGVITFTPGVTSGVIAVPVFGDTIYEPDELFGVRLTGVSSVGDVAVLDDADAVGTIRNDDAPGARFERSETIVGEGAGAAQIVARLDAPLSDLVTVNYRTVPPGPGAGTATAGADFIPQSGTLIFPPGVVTQTISLAIVDDSADEPLYETVRLELIGASGAQLGSPAVTTVTIVDDDGLAPLETRPFLVTGGPNTLPTSAYYYTGGERGYGYVIISVPCTWPADRPLTIELWSPAMHTGIADRAGWDGQRGNTSFELYELGPGARGAALRPEPGASGSLLERTYTPRGGGEQWETFYTIAAPTPCGRYALRVAASGDDENFWAVRAGFDTDGSPATPPDAAAPGDGTPIRLATLGATVEHQTPMETTVWFYVEPGTQELRLRTYDLDYGANGTPQDYGAGVRYYAPGDSYDPEGATGGRAGTVSESGWNEDRVSRPAPGWWRAVITTDSVQNGYTFEAEGDGEPLPIQYEPPAEPQVSLTLTPSTTAAAPGERVTLTLSFASQGPAAYSPALSVTLPGGLAFDGDPCAGAPASCTWGADGRLTIAGAGPAGAGLTHSFTLLVAEGARGLAPVALEATFADAWGNGYRAGAGAVVVVP